MRGHAAHRALGLHRRARRIRRVVLRGRLFDLGAYPAFRPGRGAVRAELYALRDPRLLRALDRYEDFRPGRPRASEYRRQRWRGGRPGFGAWLYVYNRRLHGRPMRIGHWRTGGPGPADRTRG